MLRTIALSIVPALMACGSAPSGAVFDGTWALTQGSNVAACPGETPQSISIATGQFVIATAPDRVMLTWSDVPFCPMPGTVTSDRELALTVDFGCTLGDNAFKVRGGVLSIDPNSSDRLTAVLQTTGTANGKTCDGDFTLHFARE